MLTIHFVLNLGVQSQIESQYSSEWNVTTQQYDRNGGAYPFYYFEAIQVTVPVSGSYTFVCNSSIDSYGYFYNDTFDPYHPTVNLLQENDEGAANNQFLLTWPLAVNGKYVLVPTTRIVNVISKFSIIGSGSGGMINFTKLNVTYTGRPTLLQRDEKSQDP